MTGLTSFAPEICSLICQDPALERIDLNSICFISHTFRNEAQRILSYRFPSLRGASQVKAWCRFLKHRPHVALDVAGLVLWLRPQLAVHADDIIVRLTRALQMCVNLKELAVLSQPRRRPESQAHSSPAHMHMLNNLPFKLTKFVNGYFLQNTLELSEFFKSQRMLETLELHSGQTIGLSLPFPHLKTLACPMKSLVGYLDGVERLRIDYEDWMGKFKPGALQRTLRLILPVPEMKSLAMFFKQRIHFPDIMFIMRDTFRDFKHVEIHQFSPTPIHKGPPFPFSLDSQSGFPSTPCKIETLVLRPPPGLPRQADDDIACAYVKLRTSIGRHRVAKRIMQTLETLTRLVFIVHDQGYEIRRDLQTGIIAGEELIIFDKHEWALVK